ncbi:MAG: hypothetical protein QGI05_04485 [Candidatus Omnitrophota bacterium]|jgi:tetratricopeptide (TPR) repeat protein|nr:hypothetical protein [Candidatus Omnitrophota bacterium]
MDDDLREIVRNPEEWNDERSRVKPFIDKALDYHNKARAEAHWKNYKEAAFLYKQAIENYKSALGENPKYYLEDLLDRIDHVIEEYVNNAFHLRISGDNLKQEQGIEAFVKFVDGLKPEERKYIDDFDIACSYLRIADVYYEDKRLEKAYDFYTRVIALDSGRPFINRDAYFKMASILFKQERFKEALVDFVAVLSFDRDNKEIIKEIDECLEKLHIKKYRKKFLTSTPKGAKKLIMEVL